MSFERILENPRWSWDYDGVYTHPHIPLKKLMGAIGSYAPAVDTRDVLVLLDDTVFGGAREGMIVTRDALYAKQKLQDPRYIHARNIQDVSPETDSRMRVNGHVFFKADIVDHFAVGALAARLKHFIGSDHAEGGSGPGPADSIHGKLMRVHRNALDALARHLDEKYDASELGITDLIDSHFQRVMQELPRLSHAATTSPRRSHTRQGQEADIASCMLLAFVLFHASALSRTPGFIKSDLGETFFFFAGIHMEYRDFFLEGLARVTGTEQEKDSELFQMAAMVFMFKDSDTDYQLRIPRDEAFAQLVGTLGLSPGDQQRIQRDFDETLQKWWLHIEQFGLHEEQGEEPRSHRSGGADRGGHHGLAAHAEVLGVRPGASRNELELAYRGRRSQYHPDRYSAEGPEAIEWATARMKDVNLAYQTLMEAAD